MTEEESKLPVETPPDRYGEGLLYDYSKFVTTLSLLALGGVLTLTQAAAPGDLKSHNIALIVGAIAVGGVIALSTANALVDARSTGKEPSRWLPVHIKVAMAFIGVGLGSYLYLWLDALR